VVTESEQEIQIPSRSEVASTSHPKKAILVEMKRREVMKTGKPYKTTKREEASQKTINWKSEVFWPRIDLAARQQMGKPNLTKLVQHMCQLDPKFKYLSHQRISEWRDKSVKNRIEWTPETIAEVKKGFHPGGHQTQFNVFVSVLNNLICYNRD
jgi:hypothetical protein